MSKQILCIAGCRPPKQYGWGPKYKEWYQRVQGIVGDYIDTLDRNEWYIITGGANGVDTIAYEYARFHGFESFYIEANWSYYAPKEETRDIPEIQLTSDCAEPGWLQVSDRAGGHKRNAFMVLISTQVVAFWDGESRGTANTIQQARAANKLKDVVPI